jgi:tetratricopeptide (TPR) repeat protein
MKPSSWPILLVLALAIPSSGAPPDDSTPSAQDQARFNLLKQRFLEKQGLPAAAAVSAVVPPTVPLPPGQVARPPQPSWGDQERQRSIEFNKEFGDGSYEGIVGFSRRCLSADGCDKLATADVIDGAYKFVGLEKDVESRTLTRESAVYKSRDEQIKTGLRGAMNEFHALPGANPSYENELIKVSDPILKKIFSPAELLQYAERNAASSDSPNYYTYLGQKLSAAGSQAEARTAFDAALERDPNNEAALSGRAQAKYELGDFPGAVGDARAALELNPGDERALVALKFSEGRRSVGVAGDAARGAAAGPAAGFGAGPGAAGDEFAANEGAAVPVDALRRSEALVVDAKRSLNLGDARSAVESLRKAVEINPSNAQAYSLTSMAYSRLKNYEAAYSAAESGLKLAPHSPTLLDSQAFALNHLKDYRGALAAADLALSVNPNDPMAHFNRAAALGGLHDRAGMIAELKSASALDPKFAPILDTILNLPEADDILYLFPGESPSPAAEAAPRAAPGAARPWAPIAGVAAVAALLASLLLLRRRTARPPAARPPPLGTIRRSSSTLLAGKYELGRELGAGGMGVVYEGRDRSLSRAVAIKRMREEIRWDGRERERFVAEAKLVAKLKHPNIVEIHAIVEEAGEVYLVFEYVTGRTLHDVLAAEKKLTFAKARQLFRGIVAALDYASGLGVIHRDLKPANIMVDAEGRVRVMDFGIARLTQEALSRRSRTRTGTVVGTPPYMAPEQELSKARKESDVYSLAVCLYESLTGTRPFGGVGAGLLLNKINRAYDAPSKAAAGLPHGIDAVFAKALDPDPDKRYASAGALLRALESLEATSPAA